MAGRGGRGLVPLLAFLGVMAYSLSMAVVSPALPLIQEGLGTTAAGAAWALTAMTLSAAVATPVVGGLGDLLGPRRVLLGVLAMATAGMVVAASAASLPVMLAGRALAGVGGGVFPLAYTIIREVAPPARTSSAVGLMSSMLGVGGAVSWCVAGPVIDHLGWRWLLWLPVCGLVPGWFAAWWIVPEGRRRPSGRIDWWGAVLLAAWLAAGLAALTLGAELLVVAVVLAAVWLAVEARTDEPLVHLRLMRLRGVWTANAASLLSGFALMGGGVLFPLLVQLPESTGFGFGGAPRRRPCCSFRRRWGCRWRGSPRACWTGASGRGRCCWPAGCSRVPGWGSSAWRTTPCGSCTRAGPCGGWGWGWLTRPWPISSSRRCPRRTRGWPPV
ncbi:MFS transporter [Actinomadura miaoliensis]|uniref:Major facilitator superfamily (MFS) profile domain-containing protein n=1 Tax=Actinomadura miaoliensis TaxID=430685 RepID=A0ABP7WQ32_9ACTN